MEKKKISAQFVTSYEMLHHRIHGGVDIKGLEHHIKEVLSERLANEIMKEFSSSVNIAPDDMYNPDNGNVTFSLSLIVSVANEDEGTRQ